MPHYKKLIGQTCYLSPCRMEDAAKWAEWDNDLEVTIPMGDEAHIPMPLEKVYVAGLVARGTTRPEEAT